MPNGIKLIVQPESVSDTVSVYGRIKNNAKVQVPAGQDGVDEALDKLFSYGTKSLDRLAFQKALDDIGANESAGADFSLQVLPENFERGVQLLADNELSPALPEDDFKIIQPQLAAQVAGELQSPDHIAGHALTTALFPNGDPAHARNHAGHDQIAHVGRREKLLRQRVSSRHDNDCGHRKNFAGERRGHD